MPRIKKATDANGNVFYPITIVKGVYDTERNQSLSQTLLGIPNVPAWALAANKPSYSYNEINSAPSNQSAQENGTTVSLVTTGEKFVWNNKANNTLFSDSANGLAPAASNANKTTAEGSVGNYYLCADGKYRQLPSTAFEGGGDIYTPTLLSAPTSSTTTYTKDGQTLSYQIGQFCRVADASMDAGYKFYQLYDLQSNGTVAVWQEMGTPLERVRVVLRMNASSAPSALRSAAVITITSAKSGTLFSGTVDGDSVTLAKVEPGDTYTVEADDVSGYITPQTQTFTAELANVNDVTVNYIDSDLSHATVSCANQTYSGSALTPAPVVVLNGEVVASSNYNVSYSNNTNAGTATVTVTGKGDYIGTASGTFAIAKAAPTYTAPTGVQVTYSGNAQAIISAGSTNHGTIQYSADGSSWSTTRPTGTNAGDYTAYWKLVGDSNHTDVASTQVSSTIAKANPSYTAPTVNNLTYTGSNQNLLTAGSTSHGTIQYSSNGSSWGTAIPTGKNAGSYTIYWRIVGDSNHNDKASASLTTTIAKASRTIAFTTAPTEVGVGKTINVAAAVSAGAGDGAISYSSGDTSKATVSGTTVTGVAVGQVSIIAQVAEGTNYLGASASYTLTVAQSMVTGYIILDQTSSDPTTKVIDEGGHTYSNYQRPDVITAIRNASHCYVGTFANNKMTLKQLDDTDGTKYADGTSAATDIASTSNDVFMRLPFFFTKVSTYATNKIKIEFAFDPNQTATTTAQPNGGGWKQWGGNDLIGKYEAYEESSKTYSISGKTSTGGVSQANMKSHARARGAGFTLVKWRHQNLMAILFYAYYGHTNCQTICGSGTSNYSKQTGLKNSFGMTDTNSSNGNTDNIVFWGLENWWGNKYEWVDNVSVTNPTWTITEDDGSTRTVTYTPSATGKNIYPSKFQLGDNLDVIPVSGEPEGTNSTGYCDSTYVSTDSSRVVQRSSYYASAHGGVAYASAYYDSSYANTYYGSRLAFIGTIEIS